MKIWLFDYFFHKPANLICRGTDISKYFREYIGLRVNESRLYMILKQCDRRLEIQKKSVFISVFELEFRYLAYTVCLMCRSPDQALD